ncbi:MAG: VTT domain-containing protein [bacterium]
MFNIDIIQIVNDAMLNPTVFSAVWLFIIFILGEAVAFLPMTVVLTSPVIFLQGSLTTTLLIKIFFLVALPVGMGVAIGSVWLYGLAYWGGKPAIEKYGKYLYISWSEVEKAEEKLRNRGYDNLILLGLRTIPFLPTLPVSVAAGLLRMRIWPYVVFTAIGMIVRVMLMVLVIGNVI